MNADNRYLFGADSRPRIHIRREGERFTYAIGIGPRSEKVDRTPFATPGGAVNAALDELKNPQAAVIIFGAIKPFEEG